MSIFNRPESTAPTASNTSSTHYLSSPENIRAIFFTNLVLLGVQEYAIQPTEEGPLLHSFSRSLSTSRLQSLQTASGPSRQQPQLNHHQQHIFVATHGFGSTASRPLELHRHVFAKGTQSTKALEFILWFLFTRLDQNQARERFKECWPVMDRHDAREFRNVAFKWLEELRKEGCFGIGHNLNRTENHVLGLFLPTIRRSYLDESIGERIEQLVLILSTYVLSRTLMSEMNHSRHLKHQQQPLSDPLSIRDDDNRELFDLVSRVPETVHDEEELSANIDSQIVRRSRLFIQEMERQRDIRQTWSSMSSEMVRKLQSVSKDLVCNTSLFNLMEQPWIGFFTNMYTTVP